MNKKLHIGLIDSGCDVFQAKGCFIKIENNSYKKEPLKQDILKHGTQIAYNISNKYAYFTCAQVFDSKLVTTAQTIAFAIEYLISKNVDLIHMSLGLQEDREILRNAINKALEKNITLVASAPSLSHKKTYPASYKNVISVTADARCKDKEISFLNSSHALFGASTSHGKFAIRGSSLAASFITKQIAKLHFEEVYDLKEQLDILKNEATFKSAQAIFIKGKV